MLPTLRLASTVVLAGLAVGLAGAVRAPAAVTAGVLALVLLVAVVDALWTVPPRSLSAERRMPDRLAVGVENPIEVHVRNDSGSPVAIEVLDEAPLALRQSPATCRLAVAAHSTASTGYSVTPPERGDVTFGAINLRWAGPLGLVMRQKRISADATGRVYPRYVDYSRFMLESRIVLRREGPLRRRVAQRADEFESLRDYVPGDDTRRMDWKATARQRRLIVRNYEEERSKDVLLVIDAGRMMAPVAGGLSKLDHAINAALMVASAAAERRDKVGLLAFASEPLAYLPPAPGRRQVQRLLDTLYRVNVELVESDFGAAFGYLKTKHRKRCLVILFTDVIDRDASSQLLSHVSALAPTHLALCITIRDQSLEAAATAPLRGVRDAYARAAAEELLHDRAVALAQLRRRGAVVLDVPPDKLTVAAVNQYLALRTTGRA